MQISWRPFGDTSPFHDGNMDHSNVTGHSTKCQAGKAKQFKFTDKCLEKVTKIVQAHDASRSRGNKGVQGQGDDKTYRCLKNTTIKSNYIFCPQETIKRPYVSMKDQQKRKLSEKLEFSDECLEKVRKILSAHDASTDSKRIQEQSSDKTYRCLKQSNRKLNHAFCPQETTRATNIINQTSDPIDHTAMRSRWNKPAYIKMKNKYSTEENLKKQGAQYQMGKMTKQCEAKINSATSSRKETLKKSSMEGDRVFTEHDELQEQKSVIQNMTKFHKSINLEIYQCIICKEAWPYKVGTRENNNTCYRCKRGKGSPKKFSKQNNMIPSPVPHQLQNLTQFEEMLIAREFPVMHVYTKPRGGQKAYKGHVITMPHNVQQLADILPRCPEELPVLIFTINGKNHHSKDFQVHSKNVSDALYWLIKNNPLYKNIKIDHERVQNLPVDGNVIDRVQQINFHEEITFKSCENDSNEHEINLERGPIDITQDNVIFDEKTEMTSFLPVNIDVKKQNQIVAEKVTERHQWTVEETPFNEINTEFLASMSFPTLFPDSMADPTNRAL